MGTNVTRKENLNQVTRNSWATPESAASPRPSQLWPTSIHVPRKQEAVGRGRIQFRSDQVLAQDLRKVGGAGVRGVMLHGFLEVGGGLREGLSRSRVRW